MHARKGVWGTSVLFCSSVCKGHFLLGMLSCLQGSLFLGYAELCLQGSLSLGRLSCEKVVLLASELILDTSAHDYDNNFFFFKGYFLAIMTEIRHWSLLYYLLKL